MKASTFNRPIVTSAQTLSVRAQKTDLKADAASFILAKNYCGHGVNIPIASPWIYQWGRFLQFFNRLTEHGEKGRGGESQRAREIKGFLLGN